MNDFESPASKDDSCKVWSKSDQAFSRSRWNSYFLHRAPSPACYPPQGPIGATLGTAMNNLYSSPKKVSTHYITWLYYFWIWRRRLNFAHFGPWGPSPWAPHGSHMYHMNNCESPAPKDDCCQVWLKSDHAFFSRSRRNSYFWHRAPSPTCYPHRGPWGPPWELPWTIFILDLTRYLHTT